MKNLRILALISLVAMMSFDVQAYVVMCNINNEWQNITFDAPNGDIDAAAQEACRLVREKAGLEGVGEYTLPKQKALGVAGAGQRRVKAKADAKA